MQRIVSSVLLPFVSVAILFGVVQPKRVARKPTSVSVRTVIVVSK
jgi:hypothetical protein